MEKIKLPNGLRDEVGILAAQKDILSQAILTAFRHKGYTRITTPLLEQEALFQDYELKDQMYKFIDGNGQALVLRPDLTLPVARYLANNNVALPQKFYYLGERLTIGRELSGRRNEITQAGIELIGFHSMRAEAECLMVINWINRRFLKNRLTIELGNAQLVGQILQTLPADESTKQTIANALFTKNFVEYKRLIGQFKKSPIYDFLVKWPRLFGTIKEIQTELAGIKLPAVAQPIVDELETLSRFVQTNLAGQKVIIDLSSLVPQRYYTGVIFKGYTDQSSDYIISGGRYDKLLANFQQQPEPAIGLGINLDLLAELATVKAPGKDKLVFADDKHFDQATQLVATHDNYSLALSTRLSQAKHEAKSAEMELIVLGGE